MKKNDLNQMKSNVQKNRLTGLCRKACYVLPTIFLVVFFLSVNLTVHADEKTDSTGEVINYGYVEGIIAGDEENQDVYILGTDEPIESFEGKVIAIYHRLNDTEDKWIVSLDGINYTDEEILKAIHFQEQFFEGELIR